jgi:hypothetical protein
MMILDIDYQSELENAVDVLRDSMPDEIRKLINTLKYDLYFGPYDEGVQDEDQEFYYPGFSKGADIVQEWISDNVHDVKIEAILYDEETDSEYQDEVGEIDSCDIARAILGKELYSTLYR